MKKRTLNRIIHFLIVSLITLLYPGLGNSAKTAKNLSANLDPDDFKQAVINGQLANEGYNRCMKFVNGWLSDVDPKTGLIRENFKTPKGFNTWNAYNNAADNYAFMVLTAYLLDKDLYNGKMLDMLHAEKELTSRVKTLPDDFSFSKHGFVRDAIDMNWVIFGASEYCKDGLIPMTEYMGDSPWKDRMMGMLDDLKTEFTVLKDINALGGYKAPDEEVNGEMLQTLSRVYWMTGDKKYLDWAIKISDYYLLGEKDLTQVEYLRMRDHGCEIIAGLSELYLTLHFTDPEKKEIYKKPYYKLLDLILKKGRNELGMFFNAINPKEGAIVDKGIADTWGYIYNAYYTVYLVDHYEPWLDAVKKALSNLNTHYRNFPWEGTSHDGYADAIEGGINLLNRIPMPSLVEWIDSQMQVMFGMQKENGRLQETHADGNFARTVIMYCLWKSQGTYCQPWRTDLKLGATYKDGKLMIAISADQDWKGKLKFDFQRDKEILHLPVDYPRINQFPEWFTVTDDKKYELQDINEEKKTLLSGAELRKGIELTVKSGEQYYLVVDEVK